MDEGRAPEGAVIDRLTLLGEILRSFSDSTADYPRLLRTITARTATMLGHYCSIRLLDDDGTQLETVSYADPVAGAGSDLSAVGMRPLVLADSAHVAEVLRTGTTAVFHDVHARAIDPATPIAEPVRGHIVDLDIQSLAIVPLRTRGETLGALFVVRRRGDEELRAADIALVEGLATHAALAVANARLLAQLEEASEDRQRTESSLAEAELRRAREKSIVDTISQPLVVLEPDLRIRSANRAFLDLLGETEAALVGHAFTGIARGALAVPALHERVAAPGYPITLEIEIPARGLRTLVITVRELPPIDGESGARLLALEDVTERADAAAKLERRSLLLEAMSDAVLASGLDFRITEWNPAAEALFGWRAEEVLGRLVEDVLVLRDPAVRELAREALRNGQTRRDHAQYRHRNGAWIDVELATMPVRRNGAITGMMTVLHDVTERLRMEREAQQRLADLQVLNGELESFSYSVSHDLRAPVRAIEGFSRLLTEDYGPRLDDEGRRLLGVVLRNAQRMGVLIDDLLAFARLGRQAITLAEVDMRAVAQQMLDEAKRAEPGRAYEVRLGALPPVVGDTVLLGQVWANLLANAVKYTRGRAPAIIEVSAEVSDAETIYRVRDNGVGFDMQYAGKLFGVFERLHLTSEFEGTGVGLALVDRIVKRHGGRVWAHASPGNGATFWFALPNAAHVPASTEAAPEGGTKR